MLFLTRLNGKKFFVNPDMILTMEETPNTVITLLDQAKLVVLEPADEVVRQFIEYKQKVHQPLSCEKQENC